MNVFMDSPLQSLIWSDLRFLVHDHFGDRHVRMLLFGLLDGLSQSLEERMKEWQLHVQG